jgi:hypothetical protein
MYVVAVGLDCLSGNGLILAILVVDVVTSNLSDHFGVRDKVHGA